VARLLTVGILGVAVVACGDRGEAQSGDRVLSMTQELVPAVERAVGLTFLAPPQVAVRSHEAVKGYLAYKMDDDLPPEVLHGVSVAYKLFGMIPDTLDLRSLLLALYTEQVVGYFDPDSATLYVVEGAEPLQLRMVLAHELVHALQAQYVSLQDLLDPERGNDRRAATQAVFEGQATLAALEALMPDLDFDQVPDFWNTVRSSLKQQHEAMPVFSSAPLIVREALVFPYLGGAEFVRWFDAVYADTVPFGPRMPQSSEHILHPERYREGDAPIELVLDGALPTIYEDGLGEFETRVLLTHLTGSESVGRAGAVAWGGDRYGVYRHGEGDYSLVWWSVWDTERASERFATLLERVWPERSWQRRQHVVERTAVDGHPAVLLIDAPQDWAGWERRPGATVRR